MQRSLLMILTISSEGNWLMRIKRDTINSDMFIQLIINLEI